MTLTDWISILGIAVCTTLLAYAVAAEAALSSISRVRLRALSDTEPAEVERLNSLLDNRRSHISGAELTTAISLLVASALIGRLATQVADGGGVWLTAIVASLVVILLGVVLPRTAASYDPERMALRMLTPLSIMHAVGGIILIPFLALSRLILRLLGLRPTSRPVGLEEEVMALFGSEEDDAPPEEEQEMMASLVEFHSTLVREVMVPRTDIVAIANDTTLRETLDEVINAGYSRLPVYEESIDNVKGILHAKDLLKLLQGDNPNPANFSVMSYLRPAMFMPDSKKVDDLLREMQLGRQQMAIIFDEYGGTAGLVTIEDLLEEIVGEIRDEYDREEPSIEKVAEGEYVVDARVPLDDVNEELGINLATGDYDTLGGLMFERLGRIPAVGDELTANGVRIVVESAEGRRLRKLRLTVINREPPSADGRGNTAELARPDPTAILLGGATGGMPGDIGDERESPR